MIPAHLDMKNPANRLRGPSVITMRNPDQLKRYGKYARQCYMCKRVEMADGSFQHLLVNGENTTHGLCPTCLPKEKARMEKAANEIRKQKNLLAVS